MPLPKCAVVIGVNNTGGMPGLSAAVSGARDFSDWAIGQGYSTTLFADDISPVSVNNIMMEITRFVNAGIYHTMIVYFAGHGILKSPMEELWLLSGAPDNPNEAVSLQASRMLARRCGIPHIVFISDACRSAPGDLLVSSVMGSSIFPNRRPGQTTCDIDMFYATAPGDPAYELKVQEAATGYRALYTGCLLEGLSGRVRTVISEISYNGETFPAVLSAELKEYLARAVPIAAEHVSLMLVQNPDAEVTSRTPKFLARLAPLTQEPPDDEFANFLGPELSVESVQNISKYEAKIKFGLQERSPKEQAFENTVQRLIKARGRESFETGTGFTIVGEGSVLEKYPGMVDVFEENGARQLRIHSGDEKTTLLLRTTAGITPLAVLPGFIGTVVVENGAVVNVNYFPSRNDRRYDIAMQRFDEVGQRRARIAATARFGKFDVSQNFDELFHLASYLRNDKAIDPTLGLYAAYAYAQAGDFDGVASVYEYMDREREPVLHDVDVLTCLCGPRPPRPSYLPLRRWPRAPFCPMLTQGWSYLPILQDDDTRRPLALGACLVPGLWTTFGKKALNLVFDEDINNEII